MVIEKILGELASLVGGRVVGDGSVLISGIASINDAGPGDITFISDKKYLGLLKTTKASAVIVRDEAEGGTNLLVVKNPQLAFARLLDVLRPQPLPCPGVHPGAEVHPGAKIGRDASIQAFAVVEEGAVIGDGVIIFSGVYVGRDAVVGAGSILYPGVAVREGCRIGERVIIHCNSVIGSDGFGYAVDNGKYVKIPQRGIVRIEDDVEIGASVAIDRATVGETFIGRGTKIDNLVQIAHNVRIGEDTIIVSQAGIAGSTRIGNRVQLGGQVGVVGHIEIPDGTMVGAQSGVISPIEKSGVYSGTPCIPHRDWLRFGAVYAKLPEMKKKLIELEKRLEGLESGKPASKE